MFVAWILMMIAAVFAGAGIKWAVDRVWPPPPRVIEIPMPAQPGPSGGGPRPREDVMDWLEAGIDAGLKMGWHARRGPEPSVLEQLGVPAGVPLPGGGWNSGACLDGPPAERPAEERVIGPSFDPDGPGYELERDGWAGLS